MIFLYYTTLILIYDVLSSFRIYYIEFKEGKILWVPGAGGQEPVAGYSGQGLDKPKTQFRMGGYFLKTFFLNRQFNKSSQGTVLNFHGNRHRVTADT